MGAAVGLVLLFWPVASEIAAIPLSALKAFIATAEDLYQSHTRMADLQHVSGRKAATPMTTLVQLAGLKLGIWLRHRRRRRLRLRHLP